MCRFIKYAIIAAFLCAPISKAETVSLSSLDISLMPTGWGETRANKNVSGGKMMLTGTGYTNGIGLHANSQITIRLFGQASRLKAVAGVDASQKEKGSVVFQVKGDGKLLFDSGIKHGDSDPAVIDLNLTGIRKMVLITADGGDQIHNDWGNWCNASIEYNGIKPEVVDRNAEYAPQRLYPLHEKRIKSPGNTKYYVSAQSGSDSNNGLSADKPWKSFAHLNAVWFAAGDKIYITPGSYNTTLMPYAQGCSDNPVKIIFTKGRYDIFPDQLLTRRYHISNNNDSPYSPKAIAIMIERSKHLQLLSRGALIFMRGKMIEVCIDHSENIALAGLEFDYKRPTMSEFSVAAISGSYADLKIHKDSTYSIRNKKLYWVGEGWEHPVQGYGQVYDIATDTTRRNRFPLAGLQVEPLPEKNMIRAFFGKKGNPGLQKNKIYQNRNTTRDCVGALQLRSKNILWKNCSMHYMHGLGIVSMFSENINFTNVKLVPRPESGRIICGWGDLLHFSGCRGQITIKNVLFNGANDDAINIHGTHLRIIKRISDRQIKVRFMHSQSYGFQAFQAGDKVDFIHMATMAPYALGKIVSIERPDDRIRILTLESDVPQNIEKNDAIENATWTANVHISGCTVKNIPTRGFLITTRGKVVVESNTFFRTGMSPILIEDDARGWFESGIVRDMTIRNNTFMNCAEPVIRISPSVSDKSEPTHKNIRVLDNEFYLKNGSSIVSSLNVQGLTIKGNELYVTAKQAKNRDIKSFIKLDATRDVVIEDNRIRTF